ncbi:type I-E CRISPR-associated protein Cse2/CasB [Nocardia amamiensis]|uniref:type I-E CRISPR-associated protein Cse2/CasB n=1 Tax=Nocardia amamiensis TaxID=404578 RepID=UPI0033C69526
MSQPHRDVVLRERARKLVDTATVVIAASPGDRAALRRALRRPPHSVQARRVHRIVAPFVPGNADTATERAFYAVASMIAAQPRNARDEIATDNEHNDSDATHDTQTSENTETPDVSAPEETIDHPAEGSIDTGEHTETDGEDTHDRGNAGETLGKTLGRAVALSTQYRALNADTIEARLHLLCKQRLAGVHRHLPRLILQLRADQVPIDWTQLIVDLAGWDTRRDMIAKRWLQDYYRTHATITAAARKAAAAADSESENQ